MITRRRIVCLSSIDWDAKWQGHQEIATALAAAGNDVLFVENTGVRAPALRDLPRLYRRVRHWSRDRGGVRTEQPGLRIHSPLLLPLPYSSLAQRVNQQRLLRVCREWMGERAGEQPILLTFLPTPLAVSLARTLDPELIIYYCVDDFRTSSWGAARVRNSEEELLRTADLVFVTSERLRSRAAACRTQVEVVPAGVRFRDFDNARAGDIEPPADIRALGGPIAGYLGGLNQKTDNDLLAAVAARLPDVQFVVVGPVHRRPGSLAAHANVHLIGQRPHAAIPAYLRSFGVGLIPYRVNEFTSHVYPAKLNEYLAMGLPIVSTPLPEVCGINRRHEELIAVAGSPDAFAAAIRRALTTPPAAEDQARRVAVAYERRWDRQIDRMMTIVSGALQAERHAVLPAATQARSRSVPAQKEMATPDYPGGVPGARSNSARRSSPSSAHNA